MCRTIIAIEQAIQTSTVEIMQIEDYILSENVFLFFRSSANQKPPATYDVTRGNS